MATKNQRPEGSAERAARVERTTGDRRPRRGSLLLRGACALAGVVGVLLGWKWIAGAKDGGPDLLPAQQIESENPLASQFKPDASLSAQFRPEKFDSNDPIEAEFLAVAKTLFHTPGGL